MVIVYSFDCLRLLIHEINFKNYSIRFRRNISISHTCRDLNRNYNSVYILAAILGSTLDGPHKYLTLAVRYFVPREFQTDHNTRYSSVKHSTD